MSDTRRYLRFPTSYRIEHWILVLTFTVLGVTGLVQKWAMVSLSQGIIALLGGIESVRIIHRIAATALMAEAVYHVAVLAYRFIVLRVRPSILPGFDDLRAGIQAVLHNFGLSKERPQEGRYTFAEKLEYWALVWGTVIMTITGFMLWNPIATTRYLPGQFIPAAKAAHGGEAVLAVLAIIVWHMYHVHVATFNKSMFDGHLSEEEMLHDHPLELADLKAGIIDRPPERKVLAKRQRIFFPIAGLAVIGLIAGIYYFVTFEQTAITTLPPAEDVVVFLPLTPTPVPTAIPSKTPPPAELVTWTGSIAEIIQQKCSACHNSAAGMGGLDLTTYEGILDGGATGPAIVSGSPDAGTLIPMQAQGGHPGQLTGDELALLRQWIESGAPEQ